MARIVINADDFGRSQSVNLAVLRAHREGCLSSASLMVSGEAVLEAIAMARQTPTLAVGLHVVVAGARPVLPPEELPHLIDQDGLLPDDPARAGLRIARSAAARKELGRELEAQFARFADSGLPLSHVDGHMHLHVHPAVFPIVLRLARRFGARGLRLPREDLRPAWRHRTKRLPRAAAEVATLGMLSRLCAPRLVGSGIAVPERVYGLAQSGNVHEAYLVDALRMVSVDTAELYLHPSLETEDPLGPNPLDLATLVSPAVREVISERGHRLTNYAGLGDA